MIGGKSLGLYPLAQMQGFGLSDPAARTVLSPVGLIQLAALFLAAGVTAGLIPAIVLRGG